MGVSVQVFGISGASTSNPFDSNVVLPVTTKGDWSSVTPSVTGVSTSNANDMLIGIEADDGGSAQVAQGSGYTLILQVADSQSQTSEYKIVSAIQSSVTVPFTNLCNACDGGVALADAIQQAAATVTQPIKITTANSAPSATITISGCGTLTNSTFTANGNVKHYSGVTASATCTLTEPADGTNTRYRWNISPHPTVSTTVSFTACASGTCSEYDNTTYYQLQQTYSMTPLTPSTWDSSYNEPLIGTQLGSSVTITTFHLFPGGGAASGNFWADYNLIVSFVTYFLDATAGFQWLGLPPTSYTQTTGGNTDNVNYVESQLTGESPNYLWLLAIPLVAVVFLVLRRR
jgi:hypothetical protein